MVSSVLILGDVAVDRTYCGTATKLSPEGPYPVVEIRNVHSKLACAGNVVYSVINLFDQVHLITCLRKSDSQLLRGVANCKRIFHDNINQKDRYLRVINRVRTDSGCISRFDENSDRVVINERNEMKVLLKVQEIIQNLDVVILCDHDKGFLTPMLCQKVIEMCVENGVAVLVDPYRSDWSKFKGATLIKPNRIEASWYFEEHVSAKSFAEFSSKLLNELNIERVLCTMDKCGMICSSTDKSSNGGIEFMKMGVLEPGSAVDVTGSGDAIIAALAVLYVKSENKFPSNIEILEIMTKVGNAAVKTHGCYRLNPADWEKMVPGRNSSKKVVFTNGCFDILHPGHVKFLKECRALGDYLIVGINSDDSIRRLKGQSRPVNDVNFRAVMLKELELANEIEVFDDDTPIELIKRIRPDILVKGGDYEVHDIVGSNIVETTIALDFHTGYSSTSIIDRCIRNHSNSI